ncbi:MAG: HEAT repeat domain-containing protein, partial [Candidatus Brocadiae bacterium]|nr:HEAT repeat domain-containing protein [Candidatus Brocadiia bacterium]
MKLFIFFRYFGMGILLLCLLNIHAISQSEEEAVKPKADDKKIEETIKDSKETTETTEKKVEKTENPSEPKASSESTDKKNIAEEEIKKIKKHYESIPMVLKLLEENSNMEFAKLAIAFILDLDPVEPKVIHAIIKLSSYPEPEIRKYFIEQISQANKTVLTSLRHILKTGTLEEKEKAAELLAKHGQREVDTFLELLQSSNSVDQNIAKKQLIEMGSLVIVLSRLVELVELNPFKELQKNVLHIFKEIGKNNIPALFISVKDGKGIGRELVIEAMAEIGKECITPAIGVLRLNPDPILKEALGQIIQKIGTSTILEILPFIDAPTPEVREVVRNSVKNFGNEAISILTDNIQNANNNTQKVYALRAVAFIGPNAASMIDVIRPFIVQESELQYPATFAIQSMEAASAKVIPELQLAFKSKNSSVRTAAANALANAGINALPALSLLRGRLKVTQFGDAMEGNAEVRAAVCRAIGNIGTEAESAIPELMACLKDIDENVVCASAEALGQIGPKASRAADSLIQVFSMYGIR